METEARKRDRVPSPRPGAPSRIVYNMEEASALLHLLILPPPQRLTHCAANRASAVHLETELKARMSHRPPLAQGLEVYRSDGKQTAFGKSWSYHGGHCLLTLAGNWRYHLSTMASAMGHLPAKLEAAQSLRSRTFGAAMPLTGVQREPWRAWSRKNQYLGQGRWRSNCKMS